MQMENFHSEPNHAEPVTHYQSAQDPSTDRHQPHKTSSGWRDIFVTAGVILAALMVAFGLIVYVFQTYQVDGTSMQPTLLNNERLIVWKVPRTWARITGNDYIPKRGDIIIFNEDLSKIGQGGSKQLVKRVIGLPGDEVVVKNGTVSIYNSAHPYGFDPDTTLPYGKSFKVPYTDGTIDYTLDSHQLFVLGDNRTVSEDSRSFGPIDASQIVGKLVLRVWPLTKAKTF